MDYPFSDTNWLCRTFGHRYGKMYRDKDWQTGTPTGPIRQTCWLDGHTIPPHLKVSQVPPYEYLPADQQPPGAM